MPAADPIVCASDMLRDCEGYIEPNDIYPQVRVYRSVVAGKSWGYIWWYGGIVLGVH